MSIPEEASTSSSSSPSTAAKPVKSWLTRSIGAVMQLPRSTPLAALRWTDPEGPMPKILHLPSRDANRTIQVYLWVPRSSKSDNEASTSQPNGSKITAPSIKPSFTDRKRPCLVDFHGGGFIMGSPLEQSPWCSSIARSGIISISVAYRLGPMHDFPAAIIDAEDAITAILKPSSPAGIALREALGDDIEIDTDKIVLSGFSSGGNVALNMLLNLPGSSIGPTEPDWPSPFGSERREIIPVLLFFPSLDARQAPYERARPEKMGPPGSISKFIGRSLKNAYLSPDVLEHPRASPGLADISTIHPSTRALLILTEIDTLAEQSEIWVKKLESAGVIVKHDDDEKGETIGKPLERDGRSIRVHRLKGMSHGFVTFPDAFIDEPTRKAKAIVMEQSRRWVISMFGGNPGDHMESKQRIEAKAAEGGPQTAPSVDPLKLS